MAISLISMAKFLRSWVLACRVVARNIVPHAWPAFAARWRGSLRSPQTSQAVSGMTGGYFDLFWSVCPITNQKAETYSGLSHSGACLTL